MPRPPRTKWGWHGDEPAKRTAPRFGEEAVSMGSRRGKPPVVKGEDGLPHCGWCLSDLVLCEYHRHQIHIAIDQLASANILARAQQDVRYIITARKQIASGYEHEELQAPTDTEIEEHATELRG